MLTAERPTGEGAVRLAQHAGLVVSQLVLTRFGSTGLRASIWDPAKAAGADGPSPALDALLGALAAAAAAAASAVAGLRLPERASAPVPSEAGTVPAFEPETRSEAGTVPAFEQEPLEPEPGRFSVRALEQAVAHAPAARREELDAYLDALRPQTNGDGLLPPALASVVREVFGDLF